MFPPKLPSTKKGKAIDATKQKISASATFDFLITLSIILFFIPRWFFSATGVATFDFLITLSIILFFIPRWFISATGVATFDFLLTLSIILFFIPRWFFSATGNEGR